MVVVQIGNIDLAEGVELLAMDYEIATDITFAPEYIIASSYENYDNLQSMVFNNVLDPNATYYARARALLSTGYTVWGEIDLFIPLNVYNNLDTMDHPTVIAPPAISSDSDPLQHTPFNFNIFASGYSDNTNAEHESTTWVIEELDGTAVWVRNNDTINKLHITVNDVILNYNKIYVFKAFFHSSSNDISQPASLLIQIPDPGEVEFDIGLYNVIASEELIVKLKYIANITEAYIKLYEVTKNGLNVAYENTIVSTGIVSDTIPADTMISGGEYVLSAQVKYNDESLSALRYEKFVAS